MKTKYLLALAAAACLTHEVQAVVKDTMKEGNPGLKSAGPITFAPDGTLFVADTKSAAIFAIDTGDQQKRSVGGTLRVEGINQKIASLLGTSADQVLINDLAINPVSRNPYLAVSRGRGPEAQPVLLRLKADGTPEIFNVEKVRHARADLPDAPVDGVVGQGNRQSNPRLESITDIAFFQDRLLVAGLSNEEFASTLRAIPYPFEKVAEGTTVEIFHGAHGRFETRAPVRTFVPMTIGDEPHLLAAYTCTPLVQFSLGELEPGAKVKGKTVAELGNRNRPLDMIVYRKEGKDYLLLANNSRGVMKIEAAKVVEAEGITEHVKDGTAGPAYDTIKDLTGVEQLDKLDDKHAVVIRKTDAGALNLESLPLP